MSVGACFSCLVQARGGWSGAIVGTGCSSVHEAVSQLCDVLLCACDTEVHVTCVPLHASMVLSPCAILSSNLCRRKTVVQSFDIRI